MTDEVSAQVLAVALRLRNEGMSWAGLAEHLGFNQSFWRRRLDPGYAEKIEAAAQRERDRVAKRQAEYNKAPMRLIIPAKRVVTDTRSLTARLLGDPLPGRSALDQKQGSSQ